MMRRAADFSPGQAGRALLHFKKNNGLPLIFLLLILFPMADWFLSLSAPLPSRENRRLAAKPSFKWQTPFTFLGQFEAYFTDHANFRRMLVPLHTKTMVKIFKKSPLDKVVVGKRGWLFLAREDKGKNALDYFRGLRPFSDAQLRLWKRTLRRRQDWYAQRGIVYLFVIAPNKSSIYPEFMPSRLRQLGPRRLDQLLDYLRQEPEFPIIDLRETFWREKLRHKLYNKTDSHWNPIGAYHAYAEIMAALAPYFPGLEPRPLEDFNLLKDCIYGDLSKVLALNEKKYCEPIVCLEPKSPPLLQNAYPQGRYGPYITEMIDVSPRGELPPLLIVHDSFIHQLRPFLSPHFQSAHYIEDREMSVYPELLEKEGIRIVIDQMAERFLQHVVPSNSSLAKWEGAAAYGS